MKFLPLACLLALLPAGVVTADTLWTGAVGTNGLQVSGVKIAQVDSQNVTYTTASGDNKVRPLVEIQQMAVDGESSFNSAEEAYAKQKWDAAGDGYQAVLAGNSKAWIKRRSAERLVDVAHNHLNRYDLEVAGYCALVKIDPADALKLRPAAPADNSAQLDPALTSITRAISAGGLDGGQKGALLGLQLDVYRAKNDTAQVNQTLQQLVALGGATPEQSAMLKLASATVALDAKEYDKAIADIQQNRTLFTDPKQQVDALYVLAEARYATEIAKADTEALKDLGIGFMRVVTFATALPDRPHLGQSLYRTAQIEEKLKEPKIASQLYNAALRERSFAARPEATDAKAAIDRLSHAGG